MIRPRTIAERIILTILDRRTIRKANRQTRRILKARKGK